MRPQSPAPDGPSRAAVMAPSAQEALGTGSRGDALGIGLHAPRRPPRRSSLAPQRGCPHAHRRALSAGSPSAPCLHFGAPDPGLRFSVSSTPHPLQKSGKLFARLTGSPILAWAFSPVAPTPFTGRGRAGRGCLNLMLFGQQRLYSRVKHALYSGVSRTENHRLHCPPPFPCFDAGEAGCKAE